VRAAYILSVVAWLILCPLKRRSSTDLHGVTSKDTVLVIVAAHRTLNIALQTLVGFGGGKCSLGKPRRRWEDNIELEGSYERI
jgi:hypothetical protein